MGRTIACRSVRRLEGAGRPFATSTNFLRLLGSRKIFSMYRILCVTAHPDDEAANFGGTLAKLSEQGHEISLVCLTSGEAARNRGTAKTNEELIALRTQELAASCKLLGVQRHELWR